MTKTVRNPLNIYFKYDLNGETIHFNTQYGVQNAKKVDTASELLLKKIKIDKEKHIFFVNAGYGQVAVPLAKFHPKVSFDITDRDFVNVNMIKDNIQSNQLKNAQTYLSNGMEHARVPGYSMIICNYNQQFGKEWFEKFVDDAIFLLEKNGKLVLLVHKSLKEFAKRIVEEKFTNYEKIFHDDNNYILSAVKQ